LAGLNGDMMARAEVMHRCGVGRSTVSESDEAGYYRFWFQIGDRTFHGKTQTKLAGVAIKRAHRVIDRKLKEVEPPQ
jgi:hypothetical protein